jgi:hypothetical protein
MAEELKVGKKTEVTLTEVVPTLFIALGGTGAQVLWRIRRRIINNLWGSGTGQSVRIENLTEFPFAEFLQIDLSAFETEQGKAEKNDILSNKIKFKESERLVKKLDLNNYIKSEEALDCYPLIREWFPLSRKTINELNIDPEKGAGQIRALSRLFFFDKYQEIKGAIRTKCDSLLDNVKSGTAQKRLGLNVQTGTLKIVVVASTAGGTGSGSFLDLGYLSTIIGNDVANQGVTTNLVLLLPSGYKGAGLTRTEANTYAALMELETCMRQGSRYIKQWAPGEIPRNMPNSPYSDVYLIDTTNLAGAKTGEVTDLYDMVADTLFEDYSTSVFANRKRSVSVNQNQYKIIPYEMLLSRETYGDMSITFSRAYSTFGQAIIDTQLEQKKNVVLYRQVNGMLKAFFGVALDDPKSNTPTDGERDELMASRMHLAVDNEIIDYDFSLKSEIYNKGIERTSYPIVVELLRVNGISRLDDIEKRIADRFEEIRVGGNFKVWSEKIAEAISNINHDTFKDVETGSGLYVDAIQKRRAELLAELLDPRREHGLIKALWMRVDNKDRGGLDYTIELINRIKDRLENPNTGLVRILEENAKWFQDLSGFLRKDETLNLQDHLLQAKKQLFGAQSLSEAKLKQIADAVRLYVRYHLYATASREAAKLLHDLSNALGKQQGTDENGDPIWGGFIGELQEGRGLVKGIIESAEEQIRLTHEAMKQNHAMYFVLPAPKSKIDELELLPPSQARQWAEEAFQDFGGTQQLFQMLKEDEGRAELLGKLRNRALTLIGADEVTDEENPLFAALDQHQNLSSLFSDFFQRAMPWVAAKIDGYLKPQNPNDQYKCFIGVKDSAKFKEKYGQILLGRLPTVTMMTQKEVGFVEIDAPGKLICYTELSGLPLPSIKSLDQWYVSYRSEEKIPVHTHRVTSTFVHARELTLDELASRAEDFKLFVLAVALGVLRRTEKGIDAGLYSVTKRGRTQSIGDEKKLRLIGIPDAYRSVISEQVYGDLDKLSSPEQLAMFVSLLDYYANSVYPVATFRIDQTDIDKKQFPTLICEKLVEEWSGRLELKVGSENAERLRRDANNKLNNWTTVLPGSINDVYVYEVNMQECQPKIVLKPEVLQMGWSDGDKVVDSKPVNPLRPEEITQISRKIDTSFPICFHVAVDGKPSGPFMDEQLLQMIGLGRLTETTKVWKKGMPNWLPAGEVSELSEYFEQPPSLDDGPPPLD